MTDPMSHKPPTTQPPAGSRQLGAVSWALGPGCCVLGAVSWVLSPVSYQPHD